MKTARKVGILMDHSSATLMEFASDPSEAMAIESEFTHQEKEDSLGRSEKVMHNKEQHQQADYYKKLGEAIRQYDDVLLFGPTDAKVELFNLLKADHRFDEITIHLETTDMMTDNQQHAFIKAYFQKELNTR
ncbi:MAG: hypothetical protein LH609_12890 [Rudanella sp.]|nr:hypothetical protein [Rudanella sp.]